MAHEVPISLNDAGSIFISLEGTPVLCRVSTMRTGHVLVDVESPVLLDFFPPDDFYELVTVQQVSLEFGSLFTAAGSQPGQIMLAVRTRVFGDGLTATHLKRSVELVHQTALAQIELLNSLNPPVGGHRAYD